MSMICRHALVCVLGLLTVWTLTGCSTPDAGRAPAAPPGATYTGPRYLYNTVGSLARLDNNQPQIVSGYGVVVGLNGTGTSEVPAALRQWLINEMTKKGVGRQMYDDILPMSPEQLLASPNTAVVRIAGIIPPGAVEGSRFDLLVTAADTSTTSLIGGRLWTCELSAGGLNPENFYLTPLALGRGPIYLGPVDDTSRDVFELDENLRTAVVVAGGEVLQTRSFELILNQASRTRARAIADRLNERYPAAPSDEKPTANAISPLVIQLNIPERYVDTPKVFVDLVMHTFIDRSPSLVKFKGEELAALLLEDPARINPIVQAWKALGPNVAIVLRDYYTADFPEVKPERADAPRRFPETVTGNRSVGTGKVPLFLRLAALEAGAFVGDERASEYLLELAGHEEPSVRIRVAEALVNLPESNYGTRALLTLLDDPVRSVRITAYESLARTGSPLVERTVMRDRNDEIKLVIDRLPVQEPLVYITQKRYPRLVIFQPRLGFDAPTLAGIWGDRLMVRRTAANEPAEFFFQYRDPKQNNKMVTDQHQIDPTLATLAYVLAHRPTLSDPQVGYNLTYGEVADAVYQLAKAGAIDAEVEVDRSLLTRLIDRTRDDRGAPAIERPETAPAAETAPEDARPAAAAEPGDSAASR
ncbi:MAG: flagellar basal body P-ring protein FlgI [Planctomycetota bacterium]